MGSTNLVFLSGGTGTPKLLQGIPSSINPKNITVIGNTGDDWQYYGLYVSPDIDSILFTLANLIDTSKWWGINSDTFNMVRMLRDKLKEDIWFNLGDQDAGFCLYRTWLLNQEISLTEVTKKLALLLNIKSNILPMADQPIRTMIRTKNELIHLQEYWVRYQGKLDVTNVFFEGNLSKTTPDVLVAIESADYIILGPSNPVSSLGPILAISPIRNALRKTKAKKYAISPIIGTSALSGPTPKFLKAWKFQTSPISVVKLFQDFLDGIIMHETDRELEEESHKLGVKPIFDNIIINNQFDAQRLFNVLLERV